MGLDFGALIPALAQGASSYMQGQRIGEHDREQRDLAQRQRMFEEWAKRQQIAQSGRALDQRGEIEQSKLQNALQLRAQQDAAAKERAQLQNELGMWKAQAQFGANGNQSPTGATRDVATINGDARDRAAYLAYLAKLAQVNKPSSSQTPEALGKSQAALAKQFAGDHGVIDANLTADKVSQAHALAGGSGPLNDLGLIEAAIQIYNPRAIVRQGTLKTFKDETATVPQELSKLWQKASGQPNFVLAPGQKAELLRTVDAVGRDKYEGFKPTLQQYGGLARDLGVDSAKVAIDKFAPIFGPGARNATPTDDPKTRALRRAGVIP